MAEAQIICADCISAMREMQSESVDAIVTDPPYGLGFMGRAWDALPPGAEWAAECLRVLKPGGYLLAFGGTRTSHRLVCAIEDAGFEIRDSIMWLYGSGFPKSLDVSKAIDKAAGAEREIVGMRPQFPDGTRGATYAGQGTVGATTAFTSRSATENGMVPVTAPVTPDAEHWQGWGTALKPAHEPIVVARKPLAGTVAGNVVAHGTGALNVDGCRVGTDAQHKAKCESVVGLGSNRNGVAYGEWTGERESSWSPAGRWPANVVLDEQAAAMLDEQTGALHGEGCNGGLRSTAEGATNFAQRGGDRVVHGDSGGASRFFYVAKASSAERSAGLDGFEAAITDDRRSVPIDNPYLRAETMRRNVHPTVKPIALMRWLVRLVTPPGGLVLDPFAGSGTTGCAAVLEGFRFVGIERESQYARIAEVRIAWWAQCPDGMTLVKRLEAEAEQQAVVDRGQASLFDVA